MRTITQLGTALDTGGGSIKTGPFGTTLKAAEYAETGVPVISVGEVGDGKLAVTAKTPRVASGTTDRLPEYVLRSGDVVFGRKGAVERSAYIHAHEDGYFLGSDGIRVRFGAGLDPRFMSYQFISRASKEWLTAHASGTTMASMNQKILARLPVIVPPLSEQRAIAEVLGALDGKIAANERAVSALLDLANAEFERASFGIVPDDLTFADVAEVGGGATPKTSIEEYWDGGIAWTTPTDVTGLTAPYLSATARTITQAGLDSCSSPLYPAGSIFMTSRATIGAFAVNELPAAVNQGFIVVRPHDADTRWWMFHEMQSRVPEFLNHANGATFMELPRRRFKTLPVRWPSAETIHKFDEVAGRLHASASALVRESRSLARTRDELLPLLMSGKVTVKDLPATATLAGGAGAPSSRPSVTQAKV